jgi:DNA-directed RNA polymerase beta' subunit
MLINEPINLDAEFERVNGKERLVTNFNAVDSIANTRGKGTVFTQDGVFSSRIFGNLNNGTTDWSCDCGTLQAEFNDGVICRDCNSPVIFRGLSIEKEGWIDLNHIQIHPLFYRYISKVVGKTALDKIIKYKNDIHGTGIHHPPEVVFPYYGIGLKLFYENFAEILIAYSDKKPERIEGYNFIVNNMDNVFCTKFIVINSRLRPAIVIDKEFSFDKTNLFYNAIIKNASMLNELSSIERIPINLESIAYKTQSLMNEIYESLVEELSDKEGHIRNALLGNRVNFSSRMVISPVGLDEEDEIPKMDEIDIPYLTALELFKPSILQKLSFLKSITLTKAESIWEKASRKFNKVIYSIMIGFTKLKNVRILINRNPTISIGSIFLVKIRRIKKDIKDLTASIHNLLLKSISGDYDGSKFFKNQLLNFLNKTI